MTHNQVHHIDVITSKELLKIITASDLREKAFFSMMAQTGLKPQILLRLKLKDIQTDFNEGTIPCIVNFNHNSNGYFTFMGEESVQFLREYFESERGKIQSEDFLFTPHRKTKEILRKNMENSINTLFRKTLLKLIKNRTLNPDSEGEVSKISLSSITSFFDNKSKEADKFNITFWKGNYVEGRPEIESSRKEYRINVLEKVRIRPLNDLERENTCLKKDLENYKKAFQSLKKKYESKDLSIDYQKLEHINEIHYKKFLEMKKEVETYRHRREVEKADWKHCLKKAVEEKWSKKQIDFEVELRFDYNGEDN